jgi:hypothetical protein
MNDGKPAVWRRPIWALEINKKITVLLTKRTSF